MVLLKQKLVTLHPGAFAGVRETKLRKCPFPTLKYSAESKNLNYSYATSFPSDIHGFWEIFDEKEILYRLTVFSVGNTSLPDLRTYSMSVREVTIGGHICSMQTALQMVSQLKACEKVIFVLDSKHQLPFLINDSSDEIIAPNPTVRWLHVTMTFPPNSPENKDMIDTLHCLLTSLLKNMSNVFPNVNRLMAELPGTGVYFDLLNKHIAKSEFLKHTYVAEIRNKKVMATQTTSHKSQPKVKDPEPLEPCCKQKQNESTVPKITTNNPRDSHRQSRVTDPQPSESSSKNCKTLTEAPTKDIPLGTSRDRKVKDPSVPTETRRPSLEERNEKMLKSQQKTLETGTSKSQKRKIDSKYSEVKVNSFKPKHTRIEENPELLHHHKRGPPVIPFHDHPYPNHEKPNGNNYGHFSNIVEPNLPNIQRAIAMVQSGNPFVQAMINQDVKPFGINPVSGDERGQSRSSFCKREELLHPHPVSYPYQRHFASNSFPEPNANHRHLGMDFAKPREQRNGDYLEERSRSPSPERTTNTDTSLYDNSLITTDEEDEDDGSETPVTIADPDEFQNMFERRRPQHNLPLLNTPIPDATPISPQQDESDVFANYQKKGGMPRLDLWFEDLESKKTGT